ncbi:MAG: GNAT family N-acetyltransferase [Chloroflexi bacterium]|nr:GNAT family N-acetyltransferase [Chloroflexota bacterium]
MTQLPDGYTLRRPTLDDALAITQTYKANDVQFESNHELNVAELIQFMKEVDLNNNAWVVLDEQGQVIAYEEVIPNPEKARFDLEGVVHPDHLGKGIGSFLVQTVEARIAEIMSGMELNDLSPYIIVNVNGKDPFAKELFAAYDREKSDAVMEIQMTEAPREPSWADGITVRSFVPGQDDKTVWHVVNTSFQSIPGDHDMPFDSWRNFNVNREGFDPSLWFLAMDGDTIAGVCLCPHDKNYGWVRQIGVLPEYRGREIGLSLLSYALGEWWRRGEKRVGLAVQSDNVPAISLYKKLGFHIDSVYDTYRKSLVSLRAKI